MPIEWLNFIEGPVLEFVFYLSGIVIGIRCVIYLITIIKSQKSNHHSFSLKKTGKIIGLLGCSLVPYHRGLLKQPVYGILRYTFHACLFIIPVWYSGHIYMLEESSLGWYWEPIPDEIIDTATLLVIWTGSFFMARRVLLPKIRKQSSPLDFVIIMITILPFITGYCIVNATLDHIPFFEEYLGTLHVFSGEVMIAMAVFLFVGTRLEQSKCVGCSSCTLSCPTGTLETIDKGDKREFFYSSYQCICCAACVATCPENAAALRHKISISHFLSFLGKKKIREVVLNKCEGCQELFAPNPQIEKIYNILQSKGGISPETLKYCSRCKKLFSNSKENTEIKIITQRSKY